jgi:membrane-bound lytic murein transglycosylase D
MRNIYKIILLALPMAMTLLSCSAIKKTFWGPKDAAEDEIADETIVIEFPEGIATETEYVIDIEDVECDSCLFEVPESMTENTDSLLNTWQARTLLKKLDCNTTGWENINMTDTMYAKRLASMPTVVKMPYNNMVRSSIDRYSKKTRSQVSYMLGISEFYMPMIEEEIDRMGLPQELKYLPVIESAMNPKAKSRMGAKGLWQFMFTTGKLYGLKSNNYIDDRFDPLKSTRAALAYLKDLYTMFGNWDLAIAAYNCGPGNVKKAIRRSGGKTDFWKIYRWLPRETRGYLPGFIAANYIMTFYEDHGICPMEPNIPVATDTIHVNRNLHFKQIAEVFDKAGADFSEFSVSQIKEKFGELRIYTGALDAAVADQVYKIIDEAEIESGRTCEWCGNPGKVRGGGWIKTLCDNCNKREK